MRTRTKAMIAAIAAAAMMLTLVANASARNLSVTERNFELLFSTGLTFEAAGNNLDCRVTLLGEFFERTIRKVVNSDIGWIRHVEPRTQGAPPCTGGSYTVLAETFPWLLSYQGFTGRLPNIERIRLLLIKMALKVMLNGLACLAGTTAREPAAGEALVGTGGRIEGFRADERTGIRLGGGFACEIAGESHYSGTATVLNLPGTAPITITLI